MAIQLLVGKGVTYNRIFLRKCARWSGVAGVAAAITAAVHHATGVRVRELPVKIEHLLA